MLRSLVLACMLALVHGCHAFMSAGLISAILVSHTLWHRHRASPTGEAESKLITLSTFYACRLVGMMHTELLFWCALHVCMCRLMMGRRTGSVHGSGPYVSTPRR
jgi:hypothetical protein